MGLDADVMKSAHLLLPAMVAATHAQAGPLDDFGKSLVGYQCGDEEQSEFILIGEIDGQLTLLSPNYADSDGGGIDVKKTANGYRFLIEDGNTAFLSNLGDEGWKAFYATEAGPVSTNCIQVPNLPTDMANALFASIDLFSNEALTSLSEDLEEAEREKKVLAQQVSELREHAENLQSLIDDLVAKDAEKSLEIKSLSEEWYSALARIAALQRQLQAAN